MEIFKSISDFEKTEYVSCVALGFFDGVHLGHRSVIENCVSHANGRKSVVLTFSKSPSQVLGKSAPRLLTTNEKKANLFSSLGVDAVIFADFEEIQEMSAGDFVGEILQKSLRAKEVFCGFNYHFGKNGAAGGEELASLCGACGIAAHLCEPVFFENEPVSSTRIRDLIEAGDVEKANVLLGAPFSTAGKIRGGNHIGSTLGFPTVNISLSENSVVPLLGVYASRVKVNEKTYIGATNIGVHPTVKKKSNPVCETFLLDFSGRDLYGEFAVCELLFFIRPEKKFESLDALKAQIATDAERIKSMYAG